MEFPNGFNSWQETHFEFVDAITHLRIKDHPFVQKINDAGGTGAFYELALKWTNEFENLHKSRSWDGDFFDEVESFVSTKISD